MLSTKRVVKLAIHIEWDPEAEVWYVKESDMPGLHAEAETMDEMLEVLRDVLPELAKANLDKDSQPHHDVPVELIYRRQETLSFVC